MFASMLGYAARIVSSRAEMSGYVRPAGERMNLGCRSKRAGLTSIVRARVLL